MNILMLVNSLEVGGAENLSISLANALKPKININLCCTYRSNGPLRSKLAEGIDLSELRKHSGLDLTSIIQLRNLILSKKIDLIHAHDFTVFIAILTKIFLTKKNSVRIVWHDHSGSNYQRTKQGSFWSMLPFLLASRLVDKIIVVDERSKIWFENACGNTDKVVLLNNFVEVPELKDTKMIDLPGIMGQRIIQVANIRKLKDHLTMLKAMTQIVKAFPNVKLFIVGHIYEQDYYDELKEFAKINKLEQNIVFLGARDDVLSLLSHVDIGVLSSIQEGTPLSLLEYGAMSLPVVVTNVGNCPNIVKNGISGYVVEPSNPLFLSNSTIMLLESEDLRYAMGRNLRECIASDYSKDSIINKLFLIYEKVLGIK